MTREKAIFFLKPIDVSPLIRCGIVTLYLLINLQIPLPPLSVQSHIVGILEKFEHMVQEVSGLLPQEIALRKKQYEYYREKLLTFKK